MGIAIRCATRVLAGLLFLVIAPPAFAAEEDWLRLETPEFTVISQLDERKTRGFAGEFDQFVSALFSLYAFERKGLPPLTIVLFNRDKNFAPYRPRTASGQAKKISGVFGRQADWSVMALPATKLSRETRHVLNHEAVHWFFSAHRQQLPLGSTKVTPKCCRPSKSVAVTPCGDGICLGTSSCCAT